MLSQDEREHKKKFLELVEFVRDYGITVNTYTKARGHQGFFINEKVRIDISSAIPYQRKIEVLIHEFTHYVHAKIEPDIARIHGSLNTLFPNADIDRIETELYEVTKFVDNSKSLSKLSVQRDKVLEDIKLLDTEIKQFYPDFKRSYPYKQIEKNIKKCDAKYLLKYDRVKIKSVFPQRVMLYSIDTLSVDFPQLSKCETDYIKLKAKQRTLRRISSRINKLENYYKRPSELFARFVEGLFIDTAKVSELAPHAYLVFCSELAKNRYLELVELINNHF